MRAWRGVRLLAAAAMLSALIVTQGVSVDATNPPSLIASEPGDGVTIPAMPAQIVLTFIKPADPSVTGGYVHSEDGTIVSTGIRVSADDPRKVTITLKPNLPGGWYMAMWNTALVGDADSIDGFVEFDVAG